MTVTEASLYANLHVETSPVATPAVWTDHVASVRDISLTRGGYEPYVGVSQVEAGSGTITLIDLAATINPGYWVRIRYSSTNIWAGYVQDVNTSYTFIDGTTYAVTTLHVLDWVAWISQYSFDNYDLTFYWWERPQNINLQIEPVLGESRVITEHPSSGPSHAYDLSGINGTHSVAEVLDLLANSVSGGYWRSTTTNPTGTLADGGMDSLVDMYTVTGTINAALSDGTHTGSPTNLTLYNSVDMQYATSQVSNNVVVSNYYGYGDSMNTTDYIRSDSTSMATYGSRLATVKTNITSTNRIDNLIESPSVENDFSEYSSTNWAVSREQPVLDSSGSWSAQDGQWGIRARNLTGSGTDVFLYSDPLTPVVVGVRYYGIVYGGHSNSSSVRGRAGIDWLNDSGAIISTTYGSYVTFTSARTWYKTTVNGLAPAGAVAAKFFVNINRSTGAAFASGAKLWADAYCLSTTSVTDWFDGDSPDTPTYLYDWYGTPGSSSSYRMSNYLHTIAGNFLTANKTPYYSPRMVRLNAQANLTTAALLDTYSTVYVWHGGHCWTSVITGMNHNITVNPDGTTRWMIDLILRPSAYTI